MNQGDQEQPARRYVVPAEVQLVRLGAGLFATTPLGATRFTGGSVDLLTEVVTAAALHGTEEAIVTAFEEDYEGEAILQCLTLLTRRGVLAHEDDDEARVRGPAGAEVVTVNVTPGEARRSEVLVLGAGRLADEVASLCRASGVEVVCQPLGSTPAMRAIYEQAKTAHLFPVLARPGRPRAAEEVDAQQLKQAMEHADLTVLCLDDVLMAHLYELRDLSVELGRPLLPVVACAEDLQVGPLLVPQTAHDLESRMAQPGAAGQGVGREALSLFTAPPSQPLSSAARASLASLLAQAARDPWGLLAWSRHWVGETTRQESIAFDSLTVDPHARGDSSYLPTYLNGDIFADERRLGHIRDQLSCGRLVAIRSAFDPEFAETVHRHLDQSTPWETSISYQYLQFIYRKVEGAALPLPLKSLSTALLGTRSREWMEALCGRPCDGDMDLLAFWYMPGGYATPHSDGGRGRSIALVWHLTKDWDDRWGGEFIWHPSGTVFRPSFNSLFMFQVNANESVHSIAPISPVARGLRRAAVMWYGTQQAHDWNDSRGASKQALIPFSSERPVERTTKLVSIPRPGKPRC